MKQTYEGYARLDLDPEVFLKHLIDREQYYKVEDPDKWDRITITVERPNRNVPGRSPLPLPEIPKGKTKIDASISFWTLKLNTLKAQRTEHEDKVKNLNNLITDYEDFLDRFKKALKLK
jgi:hypothetical protein